MLSLHILATLCHRKLEARKINLETLCGFQELQVVLTTFPLC